MDKYPFIFSNERKYRIRRHVAFWATWWLFIALIYSAGYGVSAPNYPIALAQAAMDSFIFLPTHIFLSYSLMYIVIPRFLLKGRYIATAILVFLLFIGCACISILLNVTLIAAVRNTFHYAAPMGAPIPPIIKIVYGLMAGLRGGITIGGLAAAIKLMKYWYVKEQRNIQLQKENMASQLQLLKAQIHPHFLFNTLNNIYAQTQKTSPLASSLVMGLSDLLRYILQEGSKQWVPLSKELKMIEDYMMLEQIRYGKRLDISRQIPVHTNGLMIAPLLLLPFVENCFKHGTSQMLEQAWIRFSIEIDTERFKMTLINSKLPVKEGSRAESSGIGIMNARKRLDLLYPGKHELIITEEEDVFIVNLRIELETKFIPLPEKEIKEELADA